MYPPAATPQSPDSLVSTGTEMFCDDASEYLFHEVSKGVYVRKCYGLEELASNMEEHCDGFVHLTTTAAVSLPSLPSKEILEKRVRAAWTSFRRYAPAVACKTFRLPDGDKRFALRYTVPHTKEDVQAWADETVFFSEESKTMFEKHCELKNGRWWRCSDDHYVAELHVSPIESDWQFSLVFSHNSIDGRNSYAMLDLFLGFLTRELESKPTFPSSIDWGSEIVRLPPPGAFAMALAESGSPPDIAAPKPEPKQNGETAPPTIVPWLYAPRLTGATGDVSRLVQFSEETTAKLHAICRKKGCTITQVTTALSALAHAEAALKSAGRLGADRFKEVASAFAASSHYLVAWNFINHRHKLPGGYDSYASPSSTALCTADGVPLFLGMDAIKSSVKVDQENLSAQRVVDEETFWDGLVRNIADAWKATDQSLDGYAARELAAHHSFNAFDPHMFDVPALIVSSVGDLGRLGLLSAFRPPQTKAESKPTLVVNDVVCGIRLRTPPIMNLLWEYRGRIACHFLSGGEYTTSDELELVTRLFVEWTAAFIH